MKKLLLTIFVASCIWSPAFCDELEVVAGFDAIEDLPVLNEVLRKKDVEIKALDTRIVAAEASIAALTAATQAQMETATSTTVYVSPGRTHNHPGVAKAWVKFDGTTNVGGKCTVSASYNVTDVDDNGTGDYTINWGTDFSSENYSVVGTAREGAAGDGLFVSISPTSGMAAGSTRVVVRYIDNAARDSSIVCLTAFGDQ